MSLNKSLTSLILILKCTTLFLSESLSMESSEIIKFEENKSSLISKNFDTNKKRSQYIIGPGDVIFIKFFGADFFSAPYLVNNEGYIDNLPEIESLFVDGYSILELEKILINKYEKYLFDPLINISINKYRPISVYIRGEVKRPGLYKFDGTSNKMSQNINPPEMSQNINPLAGYDLKGSTSKYMTQELESFELTKLFDLIKKANGVTNYADLSKILLLRNNSKGQGGGKLKAELNLLTLLENGDQSQNIRLMDGDSIFINKGEKMLKEQILSINKSNISPENITVFITGNVFKPGPVVLQQGASLLQAVASTGGKKLWTGNVEFIRFNEDGTNLKNSFRYDANAPINTTRNPILMSGDIINIRKTILGQSSNIIGEISSPVIGGYGLYKIFTDK